jgi:hypothetical protein
MSDSPGSDLLEPMKKCTSGEFVTENSQVAAESY